MSYEKEIEDFFACSDERKMIKRHGRMQYYQVEDKQYTGSLYLLSTPSLAHIPIQTGTLKEKAFF